MGRKQSKSSRDEAEARREQMRQYGLLPFEIWVPDVISPEFAAEARRQSLAVADSPQEKEDQAFIDAISWFADGSVGE
jgi:Antitoxin MazE-like